ncbi:MAG: VWA domain-containing protein [Planctomycetes bacterium]|nr:VWA domain-containing protein [Planctomycetota bacterium]
MRVPHPLVLLAALAALLLAAPMRAQRPRTPAEALARFEQVRDRGEAERRRAVDDLGDFADDQVTTVLVGELGRAQELGYRQAVVRALGRHERQGAVPALLEAFAGASNARLADSAAEALARQGEPGVAALAAQLGKERAGSSRWNSLCQGLGRAASPPAVKALLDQLRKVGGRDRLGPLRSLARSDDPAVAQQRLLLARDKDPLVAATALAQLAQHGQEQAPALALELHRRLPATASPEQHAAVVHGLLLAPDAARADALLASAALADDPFAAALQPLWRRALTDPAFASAWVGSATTRRRSGERAVAATALQFTDPAQAAAATTALAAMVASGDAEVVRAAAAALVVVAPERAEAALAPLVAAANDPLPAIALEALHAAKAGDAAWAAGLVQHATGRTPGLRAAALQLLASCPARDDSACLEAATAALGHKAWPVRAAAIELLVALRQPAGVPPLFARLDDEQARLRDDAASALAELTGLQFPTAAAWQEWWAREGPTFRVPPAPDRRREGRRSAAGTVATYWDLPVTSDRIVFVVDVSGSMNQPHGTGNLTRLDEARRQLLRVLQALPAKAKANVVAFATDAQGFADGLQPIDERRRKALTTWVEALEPRGATNVHAALQRAFADPEADTIFLLTDGQPSSGTIVAPELLLREVRRWNAGRNLRIHTVALGGRSDFLERLASESGGRHTVAR